MPRFDVAVKPDLTALTPVEKRGAYQFKRDDLFTVAGVNGGKVRTCWALSQGATGLVTAGSRSSPQCEIVSYIARHRGIPCHCHVPQGELAGPLISAGNAGATVVQHKAGYNNVIIARARADANATGFTYIPFGMECEEAVQQTERQVTNLPPVWNRLVISCGSGMSLAGVLWGLEKANDTRRVIAIMVGADPIKRLNLYAPLGWGKQTTLIPSGTAYHIPARVTEKEGVPLDPYYEAKAAPLLEPGDLFWVIGRRR